MIYLENLGVKRGKILIMAGDTKNMGRPGKIKCFIGGVGVISESTNLYHPARVVVFRNTPQTGKNHAIKLTLETIGDVCLLEGSVIL